MKKQTIIFIKKLLENEIDNEIINDNININEVDYVKDLISSSKDFISNYGDVIDEILLNEKIKELQEQSLGKEGK